MHEVDLDAEPMYMVFNVDGKLFSNLATPTIVPYNLATLAIPNNHVTPTLLLSQNASGH
jgi:hypothetical protein